MKHSTKSINPSQLLPGLAGKLMLETIKNAIKEAFLESLESEIISLCGQRHEQDIKDREYFRNGSNPSRINLYDSKFEFKKPRIRKSTQDNKTQEVQLNTYSFYKNKELLEQEIADLLIGGVSTRKVEEILGNQAGTSKSSASRIFTKKMNEALIAFNNRDLSKYDFLALTIDGICIAKEIWVLVALGINITGEKVILGFIKGSSENTEICNDLLKKIKAKGFSPQQLLFCALDGADALKTAVLKHFPEAIIQRCLIHKERNIQGYLSNKYHGELAAHFTKLRQAQGEEAGREALNNISKFLEDKNDSAKISLEEAGEDLIAFHKLGISSCLGPTLLNTNIIENCYKNVRRQIQKVNNWNSKSNQVDLWMIQSILVVEKGFNKVTGYQQLENMKKILKSKKQIEI
jgi:transposase-like protein